MIIHWQAATFKKNSECEKRLFKLHFSRSMTKPTKWPVRPAKTQSGHPPSLISLRCLHEETLGPKLPIECTEMTLIRLGKCPYRPGWAESSLGAKVILLILSCGGSIFLFQWCFHDSPLSFIIMHVTSLTSKSTTKHAIQSDTETSLLQTLLFLSCYLSFLVSLLS